MRTPSARRSDCGCRAGRSRSEAATLSASAAWKRSRCSRTRIKMTQATISLRNTLWLTAALAMVAAPHAERLPWWVVMLAAMLVLWRGYIGRTRPELPRQWLIMTIVARATAGIYLNYRTIFGRDAGVALLIVMLALKLLETRSQRDGMLLTFLGYFLVITNF